MANRDNRSDQIIPNELVRREEDTAEHVEQTVLGQLVRDSDWEAVSARLSTRRGRQEARLPSSDGGFLCHDRSFLSTAPASCIHALGKAYPAGWSTARTRDQEAHGLRSVAGESRKDYPLHVAATIYNPADPFLVAHVYDLAPSCINKRNHQNEFPLHVACFASNPDAVTFLLKKFKGAVFDGAGGEFSYPLHFACASGTGIPIIAEANPEAASVKTSDGDLPLNMAMWTIIDDPVPSLRALIRAYPQAVNNFDSDSSNPLFLAATKFNDNPEVMDMVLAHLDCKDVQFFQEACSRLVSDLTRQTHPLCLKLLLDHSRNVAATSCSSVAPAGGNWAPFRRCNLGNLLFHDWLRKAHSLFYFDSSEIPSTCIIQLDYPCKRFCKIWEDIIHQLLVDPNPNCAKTASFREGGYPLALMATESFFVFTRTFQRLMKSDGNKLFQPHYGDFSFLEENGDELVREPIIPITPLARILCRIAATYQLFDPKNPAYEVIHQLQVLCKKLRSRKVDLFMGNEKQVVPSYMLKEAGDKERKEAAFLPRAHMVCYFSTALHPQDYKNVLDRFLCPGFCFGYSRYFDYATECILTELDSEGNSPLHYLCGAYVSPLLNDNILLHRVNRNERLSQRNQYSHLDAFIDALSTDDDEKKKVIKLVSLKNKRGELPLHIALKRRSGWQQKFSYVQRLLEFFPDSVWVVDKHSNGLYPFMLAALKESRPSVTSIYELLKRFVAGRDLHIRPERTGGASRPSSSLVPTAKQQRSHPRKLRRKPRVGHKRRKKRCRG